MYRNSLYHKDFVVFKARKIARFEQFFMTDHCLQACYDWAPIPKLENSRTSSVHNGGTRTLRIVLPYCPSIKASYVLAASELNRKLSLIACQEFPEGIQIQVAWQNYMRPLARLVAI